MKNLLTILAVASIGIGSVECMNTCIPLQKSSDQQSPIIMLSPLEDLARFEGPYQTPGVKPDPLRKKLATLLPSWPTDVLNIIASYFFYQQPKKTIIHQDRYARSIIKEPTSYTLRLTHANESVIVGYELIGSIEDVSGIIKGCFLVQEWAYQKSQEEEVRFAEHHMVTNANIYPVSLVHKYTFGIDIPHNCEWTARESLSKFGPKATQTTIEKIVKYSPPHCIIA